MKIRIEGTPEEIQAKGPQALKAVAARLGLALPSEDSLEKGGHKPVVVSHYGPIKGLIQRSTEIYEEEMTSMLEEIDAILEHAAKG